MYNLEQIRSIAYNWDLNVSSLHPEIPIAGSPERTDYRMVFQDKNTCYYILEQIPAAMLERKRMINNILTFLQNRGMREVEPYKRDMHGNTILELDDLYWQVVPFITSIPLNRPTYLSDSWRGPAMASFLIELKDKSTGISAIVPEQPFSIKSYVQEFISIQQKNNPELTPNLQEIFDYLENTLFTWHDELEITFCHGDYHPLNILWDRHSINRVIDWEFTGFKPFLYDVANMVGCLGMEEPRYLIDTITVQFLQCLVKHGFMRYDDLCCLLDFVIALRFAWLAEWLRKHDHEMIDLEQTYLYLLLDNREKIVKNWMDS